MASKKSLNGHSKREEIGNRQSCRGESAGGDVGLVPGRGVRRSRPTGWPHKSRQRRGINDALKKKDENDDIEMTPSNERFRNKVLASAGLDDGGADEVIGYLRDRKNPGRGLLDEGVDVEIIELFEEEGDETSEEEEELIDEDEEEFEYESFDHSKNDSESSWRASLKRIIAKIIWMILAVAAIVYIFYDDEILEESEVDEDVVQKDPYSYHGYKDARIPDDDIAQYGGGILGGEVFGVDEEQTEHEKKDQPQEEENVYHKHTGIVQVDSTWEALAGYSEMVEPFDPDRELPVFWHVPKSGGTTLQDVMMHCIGMVGANEIGGAYATETGPMKVVNLENGNRYVNVDMSNAGGIAHAKDFGFGQSGLANVVMTPRFDDVASIFDDEHKGRCFTLLRHPIKRAISLFYYLKDATWEHTYSEVYKNMTIAEFATSQYAEDNWMVRFLTNEMSGGLYERHIDLAKEILESKCLVGILEEIKPSFKRFNEYFGWNERDFGGPVKMSNRGTCVGRVISHPDNAHTHPNHEEGGEVWNLLVQKNQYDMILYQHALHLFHDVQSKLVKRS